MGHNQSKSPMEQSPPVSEPPVVPSPAGMSLTARLMNIFAVPGEVLEQVRSAPVASSNFLVPILLWSVIGIVACLVIFSQPAFVQQIHEKQAKAMDDRVKAGKMTQAQADQALAITEKFIGPTFLKISGSVGAIVASTARVAWWGFLLWLGSRWFLKSPIGYMKALEVTGLAKMISVLGGVVSLLLQLILQKMIVTPSPALFLNEIDPTRKDHMALAVLNPFTFWMLWLLSLGMAKLAGRPVSKAAIFVFGFWIIEAALFVLVGWGQMAL